jgi:hypothetical protein
MSKHVDFSRLRTESDIRLARASLRHTALLQENLIEESFRNFREYFMNSLRIAAVQAGTSILTASLVRLIQSRSR